MIKRPCLFLYWIYLFKPMALIQLIIKRCLPIYIKAIFYLSTIAGSQLSSIMSHRTDVEEQKLCDDLAPQTKLRGLDLNRIICRFIACVHMVICSQKLSCFGCCWTNSCGAFAGISYACFCFSCLCGAPAQMTYIRGADCCQTGGNQGCGSSCICTGNYWCAPDWLRQWSLWHTIGAERGRIFDIEILSVSPVRKENLIMLQSQSTQRSPYPQ